MNSKIPASRRPLLPALLLITFLLATGAFAAEGRLVEEVIHSPALEGNLLGDSPDRSVLVYLPPSYDSAPAKRYPVVYLLHGGLANNRIWIGKSFINYYGSFNIQTVMDRLIADGKVREIILVMPDANTVFQGNWYVNTPVLGNYEDYIVRELVQYIDASYRTLTQRESRGIGGHSLGGFGAVYLGMNHPEVYAAVYGHESSALAFEAFVPMQAVNLPSRVLFASGDWEAFQKADIGTKVEFAAPAAFSPNLNNPPFYADWLWVEDGEQPKRDEVVWQRWQVFDPTDLIEPLKDNLLQLRAIKIDGATGTETNIGPARAFHDALTNAGIPHDYEEFSGGHVNRTASRMESVILPFFSEKLEFTAPPTAVETISWGAIKAAVGK